MLDSVTLRVAEGEFVGLVGPNGSGKTSLLRCVFRYARPDAGRVALDAQDVWRMRPRAVAQRIAVLQQETPDDFGLTVDELVGMGRTPHQRPFDAETADDRRIVEPRCATSASSSAVRSASRRCRAASSARCWPAHSLSSPNCCCSTNRPTISTCAISSNCSRACGAWASRRSPRFTTNLAAAYCDRLHVPRTAGSSRRACRPTC